MTSIVDREQLRHDLSDALSAIQGDQDVTGLDALAGSLSVLGEPYAFHGRPLLKALEPTPRQYSAIIWNLVQVLAKLEESQEVEGRGVNSCASYWIWPERKPPCNGS
jgi:hypothetical protein